MKNFLLFSLIIWVRFAFSQVTETFTDGNSTGNPVWTGSNSGNDFTVVLNQLRSNSSIASSNFYLSTANTLSTNCQWEFWVNLQFNPSSANYVDVYLISDQSNLQSVNINGYFVRIGNTSDEISLYKRAGAISSATKIIDGIDGILNTSNNKAKIRVSRSSSNVFTLERDLTGLGSSFVTEGTSTDASYTSSAYFGIFIQQSTTAFHQKHFLDDIKIITIVTDFTPPSLVSTTVIDSTTLDVLFSEPIDSTTAKANLSYSLNNSFGNPVSVKTTSDEAKYSLKLSKGLNTASYQLTVSSIKDKAGNAILSNSTSSFSYIKPFLAVKGDLVINEIFADPSPQIDLPSVEYIELYNTSTHTIKLNNWRYSDPVSTATLLLDSIKAGEYLILCAKADTNEFKPLGRTIGISPWPSLNNASDVLKLISPENKTIDSVSYVDTWYPISKKSGGWSLERMNYKSLCSGIFNWSASSNISGGTPGKQNSVYIPNYDQLAFKADSMKKTSDSTLIVYLNKPTDISTINNSFNLTPSSGNIKSVSLDLNAKLVTLLFNAPFASNSNYSLSLALLKDCSGNTITPKTFTFLTPKAIPVRVDTAKIIITEIFADPSPEVKLPLAEFVEIFNPGKDTVDLSGWSFNDPSTKSLIFKASILPNQYLILCPAADTLHYKTFGKTLGLNPWPSLNNTSDQITLKSYTNRLVDSVAYSDTWHILDKKPGGWSLERIDYLSKCSGSFNWKSSTDSIGGTPGKQNLTHIPNYDNLSFSADSLKQLTDSTLVVYFNKSADETTATNVFSLSPSAGIIKSAVFDLQLKKATILFEKAFISNTNYQLSINSLKDCAGNVVKVPSSGLNFLTPKMTPARIDTAKIYITEIFADPSPEVKLPLAEFIEIYNPGKDTIDLSGWSFNDPSTKSILPKSTILPNQYLILCPAADTLHYKTFGKTIGLNPWPSLNNSSDQITLKSYINRLVDSVSYSDAWHILDKKPGGWSLERIDYLSKCSGSFNWRSSTDSNGGTPGIQNLTHIPNYDQLSISADSLKQLTDSTLAVYFNKSADETTAINAFSLNPSAGIIKSAIFDLQLKKATVLFEKAFISNTSYQLSISSLKDCAGNIVKTPPSGLKFLTPKVSQPRLDTAQLFITEIFADPSPEVKLPLVEFIELYNPGKDTIDLDGYTISIGNSKSSFQKKKIFPKEYLIICSETDTTHYKHFGKSAGLSPWIVLANSSSKISLKSFKDRLIDSVTYSENWHSSAIKKQGGWSLERIDPTSMCRGVYNWASSIDISGGSPGKSNSIEITNYDKLAFKADSLKLLSDSSIFIYWNKPADRNTSIAEFSLNSNSSTARSVTFDTFGKAVKITFSKKFEHNTSYQVEIKNLRDCAGNLLLNTPILSFITPMQPPYRIDTAQVFITEIFADPSPEVKLPLAEFVEIYNPGKDTINLEGWTFSNLKTKSTLKNGRILPGEYLILCPSSDTLTYSLFGKTLGINPWPVLNNVSDQFVIKSFKGRFVDSVQFSDTWHSTEKKQGGWTLERIDPYSVCKGKSNWLSSVNNSGGSPGKINSVNITQVDMLPFTADSVKILSDTTLTVTLNKLPDTSPLKNNFSLSPASGLIESINLDQHLMQVKIGFGQKFEPNTIYNLSISNLKDCSGNLIKANPQLTFKTPKSPPIRLDTSKIYITEIFADPSPEVKLPLAEFVEIFNPGKDTITLDGWSISNSKTNAFLKKANIFPNEYLILCPLADTLQYKKFGNVIGITPWPSLVNSTDQITIKSFKGRLIDSLLYHESWYQNDVKKAGGWSLELVDHKSFCSGIYNWMASKDPSGGTPGRQNSVYELYKSDLLKITQAILKDSVTINLSYNKPPEAKSVLESNNYSVNNGVGNPHSISINPLNLSQVELKFKTAIARGINYKITTTSIADCTGETISTSHNFAELFYPHKISKNDILISEILFNPYLAGVDFVEIYNNSMHLLDLQELSVASLKSPDSIINQKNISPISKFIKPKEYVVLSIDPENIQKNYHTENKAGFVKLTSMPAFNNDVGGVVLLSGNERIDQFSYSEKMHFPLLKETKGVSLERSSFSNPSNNQGNFRSAASSSGFATPGYKNSQLVEGIDQKTEEVGLLSNSFSPDNDGFEDVLQINYHFKEAGMVANAAIYNKSGTLIRRLAKNTTISSEGTFIWDGMDENAKKATVGIYVVYFDVFSLNGMHKKYRKPCILAAKLN